MKGGGREGDLGEEAKQGSTEGEQKAGKKRECEKGGNKVWSGCRKEGIRRERGSEMKGR